MTLSDNQSDADDSEDDDQNEVELITEVQK
jgi:hypothetical protein